MFSPPLFCKVFKICNLSQFLANSFVQKLLTSSTQLFANNLSLGRQWKQPFYTPLQLVGSENLILSGSFWKIIRFTNLKLLLLCNSPTYVASTYSSTTKKRIQKNRAWGQSIPTLSSRPVLDFHWLKISRVLSRSQWSDYSIFITETRGITLWSYHPDRLLFRFCTANYRTFVRDCQDIFSTLFVSNAPKTWMHSICTRTPSSIIAPH